MEGCRPLCPDLGGGPVVDAGRGVQTEGPVTVDVVVVVEELLAPGSGVLDGVEVTRPRRAVLQGFEMRLDVGVVVAHVGSGMGPGDPEVLQHLGHRLGGHRRSLFGEQGYGLYVQAQGEALDWEYLHRRGVTAVLSHSYGSWGLMIRTAFYGGSNQVAGVPGWAYDSGPPILKLDTAAEVRSAIGTTRRYLKMLSRRHWKAKRAEWGRLSDEDKQKVQEMVAAGNHEAVRRMVERFANEG